MTHTLITLTEEQQNEINEGMKAYDATRGLFVGGEISIELNFGYRRNYMRLDTVHADVLEITPKGGVKLEFTTNPEITGKDSEKLTMWIPAKALLADKKSVRPGWFKIAKWFKPSDYQCYVVDNSVVTTYGPC